MEETYFALPEDDSYPQDPHKYKRARPRESLTAAQANSGKAAPWRIASDKFKSLPSACPLLRLHEEILDFADFMSPTPLEEEIGDHAVSKVLEVISKVYPSSRVEVFGSRANGLVLPTSDWDLVLFGVQPTQGNMRRLGNAFETANIASHVEVIATAKVPIVKVTERLSGITIDVSFEATSGLVSRALINDYVRRYPAVRPLALVLKYFLIQRGLNETYTGGVGSFLLILMIVHVIQEQLRATEPESTDDTAQSKASSGRKRKRAEASESGLVVNNSVNLGALLVSFFELYGFNLNYVSTGISLRGKYGHYFKKSHRGWLDSKRPFALSIENPIDIDHDVGKNSWNIALVRKAFAHAHTQLARGCREWHESMGSTRGSAAPASLLALILHIDPLLELRGEELSSRVLESEPEAAELPDIDTKALTESTTQDVAGPSSDAVVVNEEEVAHAVQAAEERLRASGLAIKHTKLFTDIFTRKERKVEDVAREAVLNNGWLGIPST